MDGHVAGGGTAHSPPRSNAPTPRRTSSSAACVTSSTARAGLACMRGGQKMSGKRRFAPIPTYGWSACPSQQPHRLLWARPLRPRRRMRWPHGIRAAVVAVLLGVTVAQCPNMCSGVGDCSPDLTCTCFPGYTGSDCSMRMWPAQHVCQGGWVGLVATAGVCGRRRGVPHWACMERQGGPQLHFGRPRPGGVLQQWPL